MGWLALALAVLVAGAWWWRRRSYRALLRAMRRHEPARLPAVPHPEYAAVADAYQRMRARAREELNTIDRQRNELRALLAGMSEAVIALDGLEHILSVNQAFLDLFDLPPEDYRGRVFLEVCRHPQLHRLVQQTLESTEPMTADVTTSGPEPVQLQVSGTPYRSPDSRPGAVFVLRNVTHLRRLEAHRRDFVANVSHELKTPITSLKGYAETLLEGALEDGENARRFTEIILRQSNHLAAMVEDLLQLSRIEKEEHADMHPQRLAPVLESARQLVQHLAEHRRVRVVTELDPDLSVNCDEAQIELAVRNLLENAIKYGPEDDEVRVSAGRDNGNVEIRIEDRGPGIAAEHHDRLFERFYRIDKSRSRALGGTGLGLAIVKHVAQAHGGTVRVDSVSGAGTAFTIAWPG